MELSHTETSDAAFRVLFQYATIGILVIDHQGRIILVNPSAEELFGYQKDELKDQALEKLLPEQIKHKHQSHRENYFNSPKSRPMGRGMDLYAKKKDGTIFPVEISLSHYRLSDETFAVAFITDISARKASEEALKKLNEELEERVLDRTRELSAALEREKELSDMKSRFVSMASHEFRTPLSAILSSVSLIDQYKTTEQNEKRKKHIDRIKSSVKNLTDILNDFLSLDKLEQGKVETEKSKFGFTEFVDDIAEEIGNQLKPGQKLLIEIKGEREVNQDKKILRNILLNLLSNAAKYSSDNQRIWFSAEVNQHLLIEVRDEGMGIPAEEQKNLFGKFYRARNVTNIQGTGLGLNIVKRYVELLDGEVSFSSVQGEGTSFKIKLPND